MPRIMIIGKNSFVGTNFKKCSVYRNIIEDSVYKKSPEEIDFNSVDVVIHLAAIVHKSGYIPESEYMRVNRDLSIRVAEKAKESGVKHFIFLSTLKVYGESEESEIRNEDSPCKPEDFYGKSKLEAEIGLKKLETENFKIAMIRTPIIYGNGVKANMLKMIKLVDSIRILPFGRILNERNFTYVGNLVAYIDQIIELGASGVFLAMDDKAISTTRLIELFAESLGKKIYLLKLPRVMIKIGSAFMPGIFNKLYKSEIFENKKTLEILKFKPPYTIEEGIRKTVEAYLRTKAG